MDDGSTPSKGKTQCGKPSFFTRIKPTPGENPKKKTAPTQAKHKLATTHNPQSTNNNNNNKRKNNDE